METRISAELEQSSRSKPFTTEAVVRWFAEIRAAARRLTKHVLRLRHPASAERLVESGDEAAGAVATTPVSTDVDVGPGAAINPVADTALEQQEIERRRNLVGAGPTRSRQHSRSGSTAPKIILTSV